MSSLALAASRPLAIRWPRFGHLMPAALTILAGVAACLHPALDSDLGWHLRSGQLILATHHIPRTDPFSHTRLGAPWVDNEWLWEWALAALNSAGGLLALVLANSLLVGLTLG